MSAARLAGQLAPSESDSPNYHSRAQAGRALATALSDTARSLEAAADGGSYTPSHPVPDLADFAAGDQVAVTGNDLLAAIELVAPDTEVWFAEAGHEPARAGVARVARQLADVRRRL